jgi:endonuclease/exonuclease/phosphatase family metal-dependent hydrolase
VRRCRGLDGRQDPERTARVVRALAADVLGVQEIDCEVQHEGAIDQLLYLAEATGMRAVAGPALRHGYGGYGNGLLTRWPVRAERRHCLKVPGREPRAALEVELDSPAGIVRVITTHFGLRPVERRGQVRRIEGLLAPREEALLVLMGDFNVWLPWRAFRTIAALMGPAPARRSFPAFLPLVSLDRIWVRPRARLTSLGAVHAPLTRIASDHLPVRAVLRT